MSPVNNTCSFIIVNLSNQRIASSFTNSCQKYRSNLTPNLTNHTSNYSQFQTVAVTGFYFLSILFSSLFPNMCGQAIFRTLVVLLVYWVRHIIQLMGLHLLCRRSLHIYGCKAVLIEPGFHQTNIASSSNVGSMYQQAWNDLQPEMKAEFGEEFLRKG